MYHVTLVNLTLDPLRADANVGASKPLQLSAEELGALLDAFSEIEPLQNADAEPEIRLYHRGARYVMRTEHGRLLFSDARDHTQPTVTLTTEEILAELDGSAAAVRSRRPSPNALESEIGDAAARERRTFASVNPAQRHAIRLITLSTAAALLLGGIVALSFPLVADPKPELAPLASAELGETARLVEGVYVTGGAPGDRGIVVSGDGAIRIFELNATGAPNFVHGTWQTGRIDGTLSLLVSPLGTIVTIVDRETVVYCGERYRRAVTL